MLLATEVATRCLQLGACADGMECLTVVDPYAHRGQYDACKIPCTADEQCPAGETWCEDGNALSSWWWCEDDSYCQGVACDGCADDSICGP